MNDFQMNLAADVITREGIAQEARAIERNLQVASRVRRVVEESGGTLPENLPAEPPIKEVEKRLNMQKRLKKPG
jgi:DNA-damage-inducible protein D